jgi:hypothetical protein
MTTYRIRPKHAIVLHRPLAPALAAALALTIFCSLATAAEEASADPKRLSDHVKILASDEFEGRGPATPGEQKTVAYLIEQMKAAGLSPVAT